jgi:hypothetical protein
MRRILFASVAVLSVGMFVAVLWRASDADGQDFRLDVSSDGSDGIFDPPPPPTGRIEIDLAQAVSGPGIDWRTPSTNPDPESGLGGPGVYDPEKWAVVFKYESVHIRAGVRLTFLNHPTRAPVVWLVENDVIIDGQVDVSSEFRTFVSVLATEPGPGGFRGGFGNNVGSNLRSGGFGPGGGAREVEGRPWGGPGAYGEATPAEGGGAPYGDPQIVPLVGGSGAGGGKWQESRTEIYPGGAGGGAILIAAGGTIRIDGQLFANSTWSGGNNSAGSGGAIRLIASFVEGNGHLSASGQPSPAESSVGRIRVEAFEATLRQSTPPYSVGETTDPPLLWPPAGAPSLRIARVFSSTGERVDVSADPRASFQGFPNADASVTSEGPVTVEIDALNLPLGSRVTVRVVPKWSDDFTVDATFASGSAVASVWRAVFETPFGISAVQARADLP